MNFTELHYMLPCHRTGKTFLKGYEKHMMLDDYYGNLCMEKKGLFILDDNNPSDCVQGFADIGRKKKGINNIPGDPVVYRFWKSETVFGMV